jgi:hypothetical protein
MLVRKRFTDAAREFLRNGEFSGKVSTKLRARTFLEREEALARLFLLEETEMIMRREERILERPPRAGNPYQEFLPGFVDLEEKLPLKAGKIALAKATVTALEESLATIRRELARRPDITRIETLIEAMRPYTAEHPRLTVARYCELRAAGVEASEPAHAATRRGAPA